MSLTQAEAALDLVLVTAHPRFNSIHRFAADDWSVAFDWRQPFRGETLDEAVSKALVWINQLPVMD